jgi:hypothetical protein
MYAVAASAAGVGTLALALPDQAKVVYTSAHIKIPINIPVPLDLNHDGVRDLSFSLHINADFSYLTAPGSNSAEVVGSQRFLASPLKCGAHIGAGAKFLPKEGLLLSVFASSGGGGTKGKWKNVHNRYLGVKFPIRGKTHYGWVRLNVSHSRNNYTDALITGYAYETIPNKHIVAGRTKSTANHSVEAGSASSASLANPAPNAPQAASLGMLALGAQSLSLGRRKEDSVADM